MGYTTMKLAYTPKAKKVALRQQSAVDREGDLSYAPGAALHRWNLVRVSAALHMPRRFGTTEILTEPDEDDGDDHEDHE